MGRALLARERSAGRPAERLVEKVGSTDVETFGSTEGWTEGCWRELEKERRCTDQAGIDIVVVGLSWEVEVEKLKKAGS